ncbi:Receptor-like kinase lip2 [Thalictrum thalictroides]|uniref:Receptor-like kinase lip2 n=1 Tax=Thalictrum thalictroides TaxID=46969 RepID=A0A7J6VE07_THATH|nr:Receptor-like kinase lip2 [Thalictrum thalictroides]
MKFSIKKNQDEAEEQQLSKQSSKSTNNTIVVGVKLDQQSKELLTWALVKVAQPGDSVVALHVLNDTEIIDQHEKSPLLALFKAFDSILSVYEGFCNLKQVDLKLKICRGLCFKKVLVHEVKAYVASKIIVGTTNRNRHSIRTTSASVAKYLAKKLSKECSVIAINNGKVVFQRERAIVVNNARIDDKRPTSLLFAIHRTLSRNSRVLSDAALLVDIEKKSHKTFGEELLRTHLDCLESASKQNSSSHKTFGEILLRNDLDCCENALTQNCSICTQNAHCADQGEESSVDGSGDDSLALVPVQTEESDFSSASFCVSKYVDLKPGWPLLRQATCLRDSMRKVSVVQWAMQLPNRHSSLVVFNPDPKQNICEQKEHIYHLPSLYGESGAIVPIGSNFSSPQSSFDEALNGLPEELECLHEKYSSTCRLFSYQELVSATSNFMPGNLIGKGGSSQVYRGCLPDGKELAVKILSPSEDAVKEFVLEIEIITTLNHNNIISIIGFCFDDSKLLLVYDFLSRGSLDENLHGNKSEKISFGWGERYKVALGVAEALHYLHSVSAQPVIHRDVKSANILLSKDFEPQLSDFGLAKWASTSSSHITCTDVAGTFGYMAPEYFMYGKVNEKIDVYAYGVVLLEILSGRKPISNEYPKGLESLVMWAKPILNDGKVVQLLDPILGNDYDADQMERMALASRLCIQRSPRARPQMSLVLKLLKGDVEVTKWARQQILTSEEFGGVDDESLPPPNIQSHLNLALLDVEDDSLSISSSEQGLSLENYLQGRCSRSSSFD